MSLLQEGDIVELADGHEVYATVPKHFLYSNCKGVFETDYGEVRIGGDLHYLAGQYVVYKTSTDGGGQSFDGGYPNGHHVFCERLSDPSMKVDFYQTGSFTVMIPTLKPIGRAVRRWVAPDGHPLPDTQGER